MRNLFKNIFSSQSGSVAVVTALSLTVLMGFSALVLDLGVSYNEASKLQNALDSAALAAARELPAESINSAVWAAAKNAAIIFAASNDFDITSDNIEPIYKDNDSTHNIVGIKVSKSIEVNYNFARVLGINSGMVTRSASAGLTPVGGLRGAIPLSISSSSLSNAIAAGAVEGLTIKCSSNADDIGIDCTGESGWFGALRFDDTGASIYSNLIAYGFSGELYIGQILDMENGNMSGPTMDGFTTRYNSCTAGCTADSFEPDCPRLVYIPVVEVLSNNQVKIVSFAAFFLLECGGSGNNSYIKATYIDDVVIPDSASGKSGQDFGLYVTKILE
ncbi:MAG: pilus assembly protein TadG-related protein [Oscillospiraceae bacterium]